MSSVGVSRKVSFCSLNDDGQPKFKYVPGTDMQNNEVSVLKIYDADMA